MKVPPEAIEEFRADGATVLRSAIPDDWLSRVADAIERDIENPGPFDHSYNVEGGRFHGNLRIWQNDPGFAAFCLESPAVSIAQQFLSASRLNLLYDQLFVKEAGANHPTRWHNDQPYWPVSGRDVKWDRWFQPVTFGPHDEGKGQAVYERNPDYEIMMDIDADRSAYDIVTWDVEPGDVYVFSAMTVHGSPGNSTADRRRRGYTVRYCGDDVRYDPRPGTSTPILVDGLSAGDLLDSDQCPLVWSA